MDTTKQKQKIEKLAAKRDKLKARVLLGKKKLELKSEVKALKTDIRYLKHFNIKKALIELREGFVDFNTPKPSLKSKFITKEDKMDTTQETEAKPVNKEVVEVKATQKPQEAPQSTIFGLPNMDLPMSDFDLGLPF